MPHQYRYSRKTILIVIIVAAAAYYAYGRFMGPGGGGMMGGAPPVGVAEVVEREVQQWQEFSGRLVAVERADIRPQVSGTIQSVHFENGALVNKGDLLFVIDPRPYEAALAAAAASAMLAESELQRANSLLKDKAIAQRDYDQRKTAAASARAELTQAKLNLDYARIKSPISGRAGRAEITVGNLVEAGPNAPVLTTIVSSTPIYADFEIDEETYLHYVRAGAAGAESKRIPVVMELGNGGVPRQGYIESFDNLLDTGSGTIRARSVFDNADGALMPGLFVRVKLGDIEPQKALLVTDRAIGTDQNKKFVLVVGDDNKAEYREIKLGPVAEGLRVVREGLNPGEKIIVSGIQRARPGTPVTPEVVPMEEATPASGLQAPGKEQDHNATQQIPEAQSSEPETTP